MAQVVTLFYEAEVEPEWQIVRHVRAHLLAAKDASGAMLYPPERFIFAYAQSAAAMNDVWAGLLAQGTSPELFVVNLYGIGTDCVPVMEQRLGIARLVLFWRARDGHLENATDGSKEIRQIAMERSGGGVTSYQYGTADRDEKAHAAIRLIEDTLRDLSA